MKLTYNWLKDFVEIKIKPQALADKLTLAGLEVTSLEEKEGDCVFEIEVTSNRPDCLSVIGIGREVAAITNTKLRAYSVERIAYSQKLNTKRYPLNAKTLKIEIENKKDCPLYTAKIIKDVKVGPSPDWLKERLELVGCRSVNNIVDITNYVLFEYGEPLHAFDLDKLVSGLASEPVSQLEIIVRRAQAREEIITIEGVKRTLNNDILVIACNDSKKPVHPFTRSPAYRHTGTPIAIAGVMGGKDTEVTKGTKNILLEAAVFNPIVVRRGRQKLGLQSESSYRFERGIDSTIVEKASWRAAELIQKLAGGRCVLAKSSGLSKSKKKKISLGAATVNKILGTQISPPRIKSILTGLGFGVKLKAKNNLSVEIPPHRPDVTLEVDLMEEIARIFGYENIPSSLPAVKLSVTLAGPRDLVSLIKNTLLGLGLNEVITYSLLNRDLLKGTEAEYILPIEVLNPLSKEQEILRPILLPGLLKCVSVNLNQKQDYVAIFEAAKAFSGVSGQAKEELVLGIALCGVKPILTEQGVIKDSVGLLHFKGILEALFVRLGISDYRFKTEGAATTISVAGEKAGIMQGIKKSILDRFEIKNKEVFTAELSLEKLFSSANLKKKFVSLPLYPGILRDISLVAKEEIPAENILAAIRQAAGPLLQEAIVADYYKGRQIPQGHRGLTISCLYRSDERTLTEAEVDAVHPLAVAALKENFGVGIR